ncbi:hypothetical protein Pfo_018806 [Paulownia fortunei]|nr:hypothetical protein Pfo_018806 [Paulownia fortunei]
MSSSLLDLEPGGAPGRRRGGRCRLISLENGGCRRRDSGTEDIFPSSIHARGSILRVLVLCAGEDEKEGAGTAAPRGQHLLLLARMSVTFTQRVHTSLPRTQVLE